MPPGQPALPAYGAPPPPVGDDNSQFFDNLLSSAGAPPSAATASGPPLPTYIGTTVAHGDTLSRLHAALGSAGRGVVLRIENRTKQILALRSCSSEQGRWQIPPPSGIESQAVCCFGATTDAGEISGRCTFVDAGRHVFHLFSVGIYAISVSQHNSHVQRYFIRTVCAHKKLASTLASACTQNTVLACSGCALLVCLKRLEAARGARVECEW